MSTPCCFLSSFYPIVTEYFPPTRTMLAVPPRRTPRLPFLSRRHRERTFCRRRRGISTLGGWAAGGRLHALPWMWGGSCVLWGDRAGPGCPKGCAASFSGGTQTPRISGWPCWAGVRPGVFRAPCQPWQQSWVKWFSGGVGSVSSEVGLGDLGGLFQSKQFCDSVFCGWSDNMVWDTRGVFGEKQVWGRRCLRLSELLMLR